MIRRDAEAISHRNPLRPINLQPVWPQPVKEEQPELSIYEAAEKILNERKAANEIDRVWKLVVQSASATGGAASAPDVPPVDVVYPPGFQVVGELWDDYAPSEYVAPAEDAG